MKIIKLLVSSFALIIFVKVTLYYNHNHKTSSQGTSMKKKSSLESYEQRRDFSKTPEPSGSIHKKTLKDKPIFVIQKHAASHLHYDVRLEIDDVLKSWAVPKGPSTDPGIKHLAIPTEDHPLEYALFEGIIPKGEYGAGTVMVWDIGIFENIKRSEGTVIPLDQCYRNGHIEVFLQGKKLKGGYALIRMARKIAHKENWLIVKMRDEYADPKNNPIINENYSALTGRTIDEIKKESND